MPSSSASRRTRNERLAEIQRQQAAAERKRAVLWWGVGIVVVGGLIAAIALSLISNNGGSNGKSGGAGDLPTLAINSSGTKLNTGQPLNTGDPSTWKLPTDSTPYLAAAGLTALPSETLQVHYHAHVDIINDGQAVPVPAEIGYVFQNGKPVALTSLHTHDTSGVLHVESPSNPKFTLGQAFVEWGVRLTPTCVGGLCSNDTKALKFFVDGKPYTGDPQDLVLKSLQEIAIWYGDKTATPDVPSTFDFKSAGLNA